MLNFANALILVIEDDPNIWELIQLTFEKDAYRLLYANSLSDGLKKFEQYQPRLLLCDLMLPDGNGIDICRYAKTRDPFCQIILLTSLREDIDKVMGLESGADDYVTKPFSSIELRSRMRAAVRRLEALDKKWETTAQATVVSEPATGQNLLIADLKINFETRQVWRQGKELQLTRKEFELLALFATHPGKAYSRQQLIQELWSEHPNIQEASINGHIGRLREKLGDLREDDALIEAVRGIGYRFRTDS